MFDHIDNSVNDDLYADVLMLLLGPLLILILRVM